MIRRDLTKDKEHIDYIWQYEELDNRFSQLRLSSLDLSEKRCIGRKFVQGKDDKPHAVKLYAPVNVHCAFDIETCTVQTTNLHNNKYGNYSAAYCMQFAINNHCVIFRHWEHVREFLNKLPKLLRLNSTTVLYTWVHNLDFETSYIKHRFDIDGTTFFGKSKQKPIKYLMQSHFYMHDSFSITNCSLKKLAEMYGTLHKKAAGDLNHQELHNSFSKLSNKEIGYICNDVFVLTDFSKVMFDTFLIPKGYIPDTSTQILNKELQDNAVIHGKEFLGKRYDKIMQQYDDVDVQKRMILKSIHGKIFGFEWQQNGITHYAEGFVDDKMFTPFDDHEHPIGVKGAYISGQWYYDFYKWLFRGGYTKSNVRYTSGIDISPYGLQVPMMGFDFTSSYPFVQSVCNFPMSKFIEIEMTEQQLKALQLHYDHEDFEKYRYIILAEFTEIESINDFALESQHKALIEGKYTIDNGRVQYAQKMTVCLTDVDYALYKLYYNWEHMQPLRVWRSDAAPLPQYLLQTLWSNGLKKQTLKGVADMQVEYLLAKGRFNSSYGLCCKQPVYVEYKLNNIVSDAGYATTEYINFKFFGKGDIIHHHVENTVESVDTEIDVPCKQIDFLDSVSASILSPFWGIWTSAFARYNLLYNMWRISEDSEWITNDVVYCDTDSMYFINPDEHIIIIDAWNIFAAARVKKYIPDDYKLLWSLGQFTNIAEEDSGGYTKYFYNFKTLGAKRYLKSYHKLKKSKKGHIKSIIPHTSVTVAGLPKGTLENFCSDNGLNIYQEFHDQMDFEINDHETLCKLGRTYHDEITVINIDGEIMTEYSSCTLYPMGFKLTVKPIYTALLLEFAENSGAKAYADGKLLHSYKEMINS